jgi:recombination protein RecT
VPSNSNQLAERLEDKALSPQSSGPTVLDALRGSEQTLQKLMGGNKEDAERFIRLVVTEVRRTPKLMECSVPSFMAAAMECAKLRLEPGVLGECYILPYGRDAQFILGYRGMLTLMWRCGVTAIAYPVYEKDRWTFHRDEHGDHYLHVPSENPNPGPILRFFGVATLPDGRRIVHVMPKWQIDEHMKRSPSAKASSSPWKSDYPAMGCKTVIRAMHRWIPLSAEVSDAFVREADDEPYGRTPPPVQVLEESEQPALDAAASEYQEPEGVWDDPEIAAPGPEKESLL